MAGPGGSEVGRLNVKVVPDTDGFRRDMEKLLSEYGKRKIEIKVELKGLKKAREELERLTKKQKVKIKIEVDDKKAKAQLKALAKNRKVKVDVQADTGEARAEINRVTRRRRATVQVNADTDRAESQIRRSATRAAERAARKSARRQEKIYRESARRLEKQLRRMGSDFPDKVDVEIAIDPHKRMLAFRAEVERLERERINLEVSLKGFRGVATRIALLARDRRMKIRADIDRNQFGRTGYFLGRVFKSFGAVALGSIGGVFRGLSLISSGLGNIGNVGQKVFGRMADGTSKMAGSASKAASMIGNVVGAIFAMSLGIAVIYAVVTALGALIVAAIGAVAALLSVVVGAAALLALPAIFAGIGIALISLSDKQSKLKKDFTDLKNTLVETFAKVGSPMIEFFSDSLQKMNKALKEGSPLYDEMKLGFSEATKALKPLRRNLYEFAFHSLTGVNDALEKVNKTGTFRKMGLGFTTLGQDIAAFVSNLANYGPSIATSFNHLSAGLGKIGVSLSDWIGRFSGGSASGVIDSFANATSRLVDVYAGNSETYLRSARSLGDALGQAVPGFEKFTAAFANMSPGIFDSMAAGINQLGNALSDPGLQSGLSTLTSSFIDLTANLLTGATKAAGFMGKFIKGQGDQWDILTGHLYDQKRITQSMFSDLIKSEGTAREKINKGLQQISRSVLLSTHDDGNKIVQYANSALSSLSKVEGGVSQHVTDLGGKLQKLAESWKKAGGQVGEGWYEAWKQTAAEVDKSGNQTLIKAKNQMSDLVNESQAFRERLKANLVAALKADGVNVDEGVLQRIDQALGTVADSAEQKSAQAVANVQKNFALLPGIIQTAMNEAKTPEQLQQKLQGVTDVINRFTPEIAEAFGKLPKSMQETLTKSSAAFETWTGLETFRQKVVTAVSAIVTEFGKIGPAIGQISQPIMGLGAQFTTASASMQGFNAQINWTNWILNQAGAQAAWASYQMGTFGSNASRAASSTGTLNTKANGLQGAFNRAGAAAQVASGLINGLGSMASATGAGFSAFATRVSQSMTTAHQAVGSWTWAMEQRLAQFQSRSAAHGRLTSFVSSVSSSMRQAENTVSRAVSNMLSQLQRLNTTVTTTININRNETTRKRTIDEGDGKNLPGPKPFAPRGATAFEPPARGVDVAMATVGRTISRWKNSAASLVKETAPAESGGTSKNYTFNNTIVGDQVPVEKKLVKQLRFADALYGN